MRLILVDGNAILHRAYHALPPLTNRQGQVVNAVYGFCTMLFRVVEDLKPTHLAVAFDTEKPTFRHAAFVGYQAQRPRTESDLSEQFAIARDVLQAAGIPIFAVPGYEADDVIGTLALQATEIDGRRSKVEGRNLKMEDRSSINPQSSNLKSLPSTVHHPSSKIEVIIVTGDRDLLQLVNKNVKVYLPVKGLTEARLVDEAGVKEYIGVPPEEIVDYKALVGDQSDNYPGVAGIGPKTAVSLLSKFRSLEKIYKNLGKIELSVVARLSEGHASAILSQELARIRTDVPVTLDMDGANFKGFKDNEGFIEKLQELGFRSLVGRLTGRPKTQKAQRENQLKLVD